MSASCERGRHLWERLWKAKNSSVWPLLPLGAGDASEYCTRCGLMRMFNVNPHGRRFIYTGRLSAELIKKLENAYDDPKSPFIPMQIVGEKESGMNEEKDRELGILVRRMPKNSKLFHCADGSWSYGSGGSGAGGFRDPEGALSGLRETFAEQWLRYYDEYRLDDRANRINLYSRALRETGKKSKLGSPQ